MGTYQGNSRFIHRTQNANEMCVFFDREGKLRLGDLDVLDGENLAKNFLCLVNVNKLVLRPVLSLQE